HDRPQREDLARALGRARKGPRRAARERAPVPDGGAVIWRRYRGDRAWHLGREALHSYVTYCHGRWALTDEREGLVERCESPPHDDRCEACERQRLEEVRIEQGLSELRASETYDTPRARVVTWPDFDL